MAMAGRAGAAVARRRSGPANRLTGTLTRSQRAAVAGQAGAAGTTMRDRATGIGLPGRASIRATADFPSTAPPSRLGRRTRNGLFRPGAAVARTVRRRYRAIPAPSQAARAQSPDRGCRTASRIRPLTPVRSPDGGATSAGPRRRTVRGGWCRRPTLVAADRATTPGIATKDCAADGTAPRPTPLRTVPFRSGRPRRGQANRLAPGAAQPHLAPRRQPTTARGSATRQRWRCSRAPAHRRVPGRWGASAPTSQVPDRR